MTAATPNFNLRTASPNASSASDTMARRAAAEQVRHVLSRMVHARELPGAQYVAVDGQGTVLALTAGVADARSGQPMDAHTLQMAYSITKVITALAVMQLVERGKLELDQPLSDAYSQHPYGAAITIRMLLAHTAGLPNPMPLHWFARSRAELEREDRLAAILRASPRLTHEPGTRYRYSNVGYWLLERAIERVSAQDYAAYVRHSIFEPVGVAPGAATFELPIAEQMATGHTPRLHPMTMLLRALTPSRYWAAPASRWSRAHALLPHGRAYGGLFCSALALAAVLSDLLSAEPQLLSVPAREQMFCPQRTLAGAPISGTLGWVEGQLSGRPYFGKQGGGFGFHGNVRIYPRLGLGTVLLANRTEISPGPIDARSDALDVAWVQALGGMGPEARA